MAKKKGHRLLRGSKKAERASPNPQTGEATEDSTEPRLYIRLTPMAPDEQTLTTNPALTSVVMANDERAPIAIDNELFTGVVCIRVQDFSGWTPINPKTGRPRQPIPGSAYFDGHRRQFSLQVMGRFKQPFDGDDVLFGTWFDRPLRLPHGWSLAVGIMQRIDASMAYELDRPDPYLYSPLICAMNTVREVCRGVPPNYSHADIRTHHWDYWDGKRLEENLPLVADGAEAEATLSRTKMHSKSAPATPSVGRTGPLHDMGDANGSKDLADGVSDMELAAGKNAHCNDGQTKDAGTDSLDDRHSFSSAQRGGIMGFLFGGGAHGEPASASSHSAHARRRHYLDARRRKQFVFSPDAVYSFDFYSPYVDVARMRVKLGISIDLRSYLNDQPVVYYARCRSDPSKVFFRIEIGQL